MTRVALLWHMHQPYYEDLVTREHILPWVRLHGLKDYFGMVALVREFPAIRMTFNLVPSLLVQLEAFAANRARDRYLDVGLKPAAELTGDDVGFMVQNFFHAQRQRMIEPYPRYRELLARRGSGAPSDIAAAVRRFSEDDLRDLQVWQKLAWLDPIYLEGDSRARALVAKDRGFSEDDKVVLREIELELLNAVIPGYRDAAARGQVELSTSPFYHPILPLLCDTEIYRRTHPDARSPRHRFMHPEDAREQLDRAVACHERLFGERPAGLWPSEGSVSDAMVPLAAAAGFTWMATDELILARTLGTHFHRDAGQVDQPERLYRPYEVRAGGSAVTCLFRDHSLSDLIGFAYAGWSAEAAADDFTAKLIAAGRRYAERTGGGEATIPIILDGENAWEHFEGGGRPFLRALYGRLSTNAELRTITMQEAARTPAGADVLNGIFPGSWIDANFYIWIGHRDDHLAWSQLAEARQAVATPNGDPAAAARAREEVLIAEGSDWFWWYGDDHSSEHDLEFDDLFRRHLRNVYRLLGKPIPDELFVSNISAGAPPPAEHQPAGLLAPVLDGEETTYFEWVGAGLLEARQSAGTMHQAERSTPIVTLLQFGFDRDRLYVRLDGERPLVDLLGEGFEFSLKFLNPVGVRYSVKQDLGRLTGRFWDWQAIEPHWVARGPGRATAAAGTILEMALPLADLIPDEPARREVAFFLAVYQDDVEIERHPAHRPIEASIPDERFEARHWTA